MRIVNPCFGLRPEALQGRAGAVVLTTDWASDPIAIISNSKPNARELLEGVRQKMSAFREIGNIEYHAKTTAALPASDEMNAEIASRYKGAILALAD